MSREAMQLALEALDSDNPDIQLRAAIALRQALETEREWVGLTDDEINLLSCEMVKGDKSVNWLCKVLESKIKEKNT